MLRGLGQFTLVVLSGVISLVPFDALGVDTNYLKETQAMIDTQKQNMDTLLTKRYLECVDEETIHESINTVKKGGELSFSKTVESQLDKGLSFTIGTAASMKLFSYDLAEKKGALADGAGFGAPIRIYNGNIHLVKDECRPRSYRRTSLAEDRVTGVIGNHLLSITPTIYFGKTVEASDIAIQPALILSFLNDILHMGAGFNLSGQNQGNVFLVFGIGTQLPGETK